MRLENLSSSITKSPSYGLVREQGNCFIQFSQWQFVLQVGCTSYELQHIVKRNTYLLQKLKNGAVQQRTKLDHQFLENPTRYQFQAIRRNEYKCWDILTCTKQPMRLVNSLQRKVTKLICGRTFLFQSTAEELKA